MARGRPVTSCGDPAGHLKLLELEIETPLSPYGHIAAVLFNTT